MENIFLPRRFHLIGIAGVGMSALARLLSECGAEVTGSDIRESEAVQKLRSLGIKVTIGNDTHLPRDIERLIFSPAIPKLHQELLEARESGVQTQSRAQALSELVNARRPICVSGSHGKSTTAAMLSFVLEQSGCDPGYMIGAVTRSLHKENATVGTGPFVLEACEAFGALHDWSPGHCIITNLDDEHAEHYGGRDGLKHAFRAMLHRVPNGGTIVVCGEDQNLVALCDNTKGTVVTYGIGDPRFDYSAQLEESETGKTTFIVQEHRVTLGRLELAVPGTHNVKNALAVAAFAISFGISFDDIANALMKFQGVDRRCQLLGTPDGIHVYDDYAHHPVELAAVMEVMKRVTKGRLVVAFEPQLHSRVRRLARAFAEALSGANLVLLMPVDTAGESILEASDDLLVQALELSAITYLRVTTKEEVVASAMSFLTNGDTFIAVGPRSGSEVARSVLDGLGSRTPTVTAVTAKRLSIALGNGVDPGRSNELLLDKFLINEQLSPNAIAAVCDNVQLTYRELANRSRNLAHRLLEQNIGREQVVAVKLGRSINRPIAFLGTLMAGGVYLPISPNTPPDRISFITEDADACVFIVDTKDSEIPADVPTIEMSKVTDQVAPKVTDLPILQKHNAAYIIYTSGSTGVPKGVIVEHGALSNCAIASTSEFNITSGSRVSQVSSFGFDIAVGDMAMALYAGACLVFPNDHEARPGTPLGTFLRVSSITHLSLTPSALSTLPWYDYPDLTHIIVCGEKCPQDLAARWRKKARFFNAYGPAEATVWCTVDECVSDEPVTIGHALPNTQIYLLDDNRKVVPIGTTGEIWISGACLARGYLARPELTEERFTTIVANDSRIRAYKTGDLGTMLANGKLQFLGRADDQIKLRGFRIELGEIEMALRRHPDIRDAIVDVRKDQAGVEKLVAYLIARRNRLPSNDAIANFLGSWLPSYMWPSTCVRIEEIPINQNGKRDRAQLPTPVPSMKTNNARKRKAFTSIEKSLIEIFRKELSYYGELGVRDTFTELGLDSLQTANIFLATELQFQIELPSEAFSTADTIELLAIHVANARFKERAETTPHNVDIDSIVRKQLGHLAAWTGSKLRPDSLIVSRSIDGDLPPLFWCFQGTQEHTVLATHLGPRQPLHGMRSGHLVFRYKPEHVKALARRYVEEMLTLHPSGPFRVGGNCQGGLIAREIAMELRSRGRDVDLLVLLGVDHHQPYDGQVALIFGSKSERSPYQSVKDPDQLFTACYGRRYAVSFIPEATDDFFISPIVEKLATMVSGILRQLGDH